jgi:hypothetical protein
MPGRILARYLFPALFAMRATFAGQLLVVMHPADGSWSFQPAESILLNGKDKLRGVPLSPAPPAAWDAKLISHLAEARLSEFSLVRRASDGTLLGHSNGGDWRLLLPEGLKSKTAKTARQIWNETTVQLKKDRNDKFPSVIRWEEIYAILPGADAAQSAAALATDISWHLLPGTEEAEAFRQMLAFLPQAAKSFQTGPAAETIRSYLARGMSERLGTWRDGDAEVTVLEQASALADASAAAFPADAALTGLRGQVQTSRQWLDRRVAILRALDAGKQSDPFLLAYRDFEPFDKSFQALSKARAGHLNASAAAHLETARQLHSQADFSAAIRHLLIAKWRDPKLPGVDDLLEQVRLEAARLSAQKFAEARGNVDPRAPAQVQLQRKLLLVEQYLADGKQEEAEKALQEAAVIDPDEPRLALLEARLAIAHGELGKALAMLDNFAGTAPTQQDFAEGEKLRASVIYNIDKQRPIASGELAHALDEQRFSSALESSAQGLKIDNEAPKFLFYAGVNACVLRNCDRAAPLLRRYLDVTDSTQADRRERMAAVRLLRESEKLALADTARADRSAMSWFSGAPISHGVFYDPVSLAFQTKVVRIEASDHLNVAYDWNGNQLRGVHNKYEEKKTTSNIVKLAIAGAAASQGIGSVVGWRTPDRETNDFYFNYYDDAPQVLKVSRDNVMVKSHTIPISIPGIGGFGGLGMLGGLGGGFGGLSGMLGGTRGLGGMRGLTSLGGGLKGMPGLPMSGGVSGGFPGGLGATGGFNSFGAVRQFIPSQNYSIHSDPDGGSSAGYLTLWNNPRVDTRLAWKATGKRAAVGFSGNRFFHPFVWDAIHLFELDYDDQGRILHAWEMADPNAPRLDFTWEGQRLLKVTGHEKSSENVIYTRVLNYSGDRLVSEAISYQSGKGSKIEYKYDKRGKLLEADCDTDQSLDGRSRKIHFMAEEE